MKDYFWVLQDENEMDPCPPSQLISYYRLRTEEGKKHRELPGSEPVFLDWANWEQTLVHIFKSKYFFRRFSKPQLIKHLKSGKIQTY